MCWPSQDCAFPPNVEFAVDCGSVHQPPIIGLLTTASRGPLAATGRSTDGKSWRRGNDRGKRELNLFVEQIGHM
jgi:hypothetical protein